MPKHILPLTLILTTWVFMPGCLVGPDYMRPLIPLNSRYSEFNESNITAVSNVKKEAEEVGFAQSLTETPDESKKAEYAKIFEGEINEQLLWWGSLNDPILDELLREAFYGGSDGGSANLSLREMYWRVQQYRAQVGAVRAELFPQLAENGSYTHSKPSGSTQGFDRWAVGTSMNWEVDIFGRLRRYTEAAWADLETQEEVYRDVAVMLTANIAIQYINVRLYQNQIDIAEKNIKLRKHTVRLTQEMIDLGKGSLLDIAQAKASLSSIESDLPLLRSQYRASLNRLSILMGQSPGYIDARLAVAAPIPTPPEAIMVGIPADLIRRRPDIRTVESRLVAQNARIGGAMGDLYPIFSLNGSFGLEARDFSALWDVQSISTSVSPGFRWNILNFGRFRSNVRRHQFALEELLATYELTLIQAAEEVDNSITSYVNERERLTKLRSAVEFYTEALAYSEVRYRDGNSDFQRLLDSQREKLSFELQRTRSEAQTMVEVVNLYRALGGGYLTRN